MNKDNKKIFKDEESTITVLNEKFLGILQIKFKG
jgi:hypothetical protein